MPPEVKLASTLHYLGGGEVYDICDEFGYDRSTTYSAINMTIRSILASDIRLYAFNPDDPVWLQQKAEMMMGSFPNNPLGAQCVAAIDGIAIEIEEPEAEYGPIAYRNQKGFFAIVCEGMCDADYRFLMFDCSSPGGTHDSVAFEKTKHYHTISAGLPGSYWIAGDSAYALSGSLLKPYVKPKTIWEDSYNIHHSQL